MNEPVAWMSTTGKNFVSEKAPSYVKRGINGWIPLYTHPVKEFNDGGEPVKNATYWKRQYNLMASQNDNLKSGLYHANEQIKYLEGQLDTRTKELIGASFYEHDYKTMMANNEPVAWWTGEFNDEADDFMFDKTKQNHMNHVNSRTHEFFPIPLYTHPVKEDEGKVCAMCGAIAYDPVITHPVKEQGNPVAWRSKDRDGYWCIYQSPVKGAEPLYTGFKELTYEDLMEIFYEMTALSKLHCEVLTKAILRKAQEK